MMTVRNLRVSENMNHWLGAFVLVVLIPNVPLAIMTHYYALVRPVVNYDYLLSALVIFIGPRVVGVIILAALVVIDSVTVLVQVFPFIRIDDLVYLARYVFLASSDYILVAGVATAWFFLVVLAGSLMPKFTRLEQGLVLHNIGLVFLFAHVYYGASDMAGAWRHESQGAWVSSQALNYIDLRTNNFTARISDSSQGVFPVNYAGELGAWYRLNPDSHDSRMMLVINESWGVLANTSATEAVMSPLLARTGLLANVRYGDVHYSGATLDAELRELCSLAPENYGLKFVESGFEECLPKRLKAMGYKTHAMHGAVGMMYDRVYWYPRVGFDESTFFESKEWPRRCFSFPGACDLDMRDEVLSFFSGDGKRFMYWLTLNTHSVYDSRDLRSDYFKCEEYSVDPASMSCRNMKLQSQFFAGIAEMMQNPVMKGVRVRIIGDHPPPIFDQDEKEAYYVESRIPWLEFSVR